MDQQTLKLYVEYDSSNGVFTWLPRTPEMFDNSGPQTREAKCAAWNHRYANSKAGSKSRRGRRQICINYKWYMAHRLAWLYVYGEWPAKEIDHINRDQDDNRISNLRGATRRQNLANRGAWTESGYKGVYWRADRNRWVARICVGRKLVYLGHYRTKTEAGQAYQSASQKQFGEYAFVIPDR